MDYGRDSSLVRSWLLSELIMGTQIIGKTDWANASRSREFTHAIERILGILARVNLESLPAYRPVELALLFAPKCWHSDSDLPRVWANLWLTSDNHGVGLNPVQDHTRTVALSYSNRGKRESKLPRIRFIVNRKATDEYYNAILSCRGTYRWFRSCWLHGSYLHSSS